MPRKYDALLSALADGTSEVVEGTINDYLNPPPDGPVIDPIDCVNEIGQSNGYVEGRNDFEAQVAGTFEAPGDPMEAYPDAFNACDGVVEPVAQEINIPSIGNPFVTFAEVAFTPTEANPGEAEWLAQAAMPDAYQSGYETGYDAGGVDAFDAKLDERLSIDFGKADPVEVEPVPIDAPVAALDFDIGTYEAPTEREDSSFGGGGGGDNSDGGSGSSD